MKSQQLFLLVSFIVTVCISLAYGLDQELYTQTGEFHQDFLQQEKNINGGLLPGDKTPNSQGVLKKPEVTVTTTTPKSKGWFSWFRRDKDAKKETTSTTPSTGKQITPKPIPASDPSKAQPSITSSNVKPVVKPKEDFPALPQPKYPAPIPASDPHKPQQSVTSPNVKPVLKPKEDFPALPQPKNPTPAVNPTFPVVKPNQPSSSTSTTKNVPLPNKKEDFPALPSPNSNGKVKDLINFYEKNGGNSPPNSYSGAVASNNKGRDPNTRPSSPSGTTAKPTPQTGTLITDQELQSLSEELYKKDENNVANFITLNLQAKTNTKSNEDKAPLPLFTINNKEFWNVPTVSAFVALLDNYEKDVTVNEHVTGQERIEETAFLDAVMNSPIIKRLMSFLKDKGLVSPDPRLQRDLLRQLWFTTYSRARGKTGSSGFEHVFLAEVKEGGLIGGHNWIYFVTLEQANKANYLGYISENVLDGKRDIIRPHFSLDGMTKPVNAILVKSSPEFDLAIFTLCFVTRPDHACPLKFSGKSVNVMTYTYRYRSKNLIGTAYVQV